MMRAVPFLASFITAATMLLGTWLGGWWTFLAPIVTFIGIPLADPLLGHDRSETLAEGEPPTPFDNVVRLWVPVNLLAIAVALRAICWGSPTTVEIIGITLSTGLVTVGGGINAAHELMHRAKALDRGLAEVLMTLACYTHFCIEHVHGHHRNVASPLDPASARRGEAVYAFVPRSIVGGLISAVRLERARMRRRKIPVLSLKNRLLRHGLLNLVSFGGIGLLFGPKGMLFFGIQGLIALCLLEVINYIEHYGLQRAETRPGVYERVQPEHSWNTTLRLSNWWLFNLQRHADHHANASRPYYHLRPFHDRGPQLPFGYPTAILTALVPPLWFRVMDPLVDAARTHHAPS